MMAMLYYSIFFLALMPAILSVSSAEATLMKSFLSRGVASAMGSKYKMTRSQLNAPRKISDAHHDAYSCRSSLAFVSSSAKTTETRSQHAMIPHAAFRPMLPTPTRLQKLIAQPLRMMSSSSSSSPSSSNPNDDTKNADVNISIEYCSACRWMLRSSWIASELLTTFANESKLSSVTLISQSPPLCEGGIFRVYASTTTEGMESKDGKVLLWDRKVEGKFPEAKEVKQLVRDCVNPNKDLGHSDNKHKDDSPKEVDCIECKEEQEGKTFPTNASEVKKQSDEGQDPMPYVPPPFYEQNQVSIEYSTGALIESSENSLYCATYYANEVLNMVYERNAWWKKYVQQQEEGGDSSLSLDELSVPTVVDSVTLIPNRREGGILRIKLNDKKLIYEQSPDDVTVMMDGRHLRNMVKDAIMNGSTPSDEDNTMIEIMGEDEAEEARKFFGVF